MRDSAPELNLVTRARARGDHAVYLAWESDAERRRALEIIGDHGLRVMTADNESTATEEQSYDF